MLKFVSLRVLFATVALTAGIGTALAQNVVTVALNADARTLDPLSTRDTTTSLVLRNIYESLFDWESGRLSPLLARDYSWDGELLWTISLREDVTFHNGEPFNADSVVATFEYVLDPENQALTRSRIEQIVGGSKVDEFTVVFETNEPHVTMLQSLQAIMIAPAAILAEDGVQTLTRQPVGTGAYRFNSWSREQAITLEAHEDYHGGAPSIQTVRFMIMPDVNSRLSALLAGEIDLMYNLPPQAMAVVERSVSSEIRAATPGRRVMFIGLDNLAEGPLQDKRVRQALNHAIDIDLLISAIMEGHATRVPGALVPQNQHADASLQAYDYDPERARELLGEAGYGDGLRLVFNTPQGRYLKDLEVVQAISSQLELVGITVQIVTHEWGNFLERLEGRTLGDMYLNGRPDLELDGSILRNFFLTGQPFVSFSDPAIDEQLSDAAVLVDPAERTEAYHLLQGSIKEAAPWVFLWAQHDLYGVSSRLQWQPRDDEQILLRFASLK
jgi:peptide/nickel transport system substrate-binding protein